MSYIGNPIISTDFPKDTFSGTGSITAFTMSIAPASVNAVLVAVSGVVQEPSTYTVSGTTLTFSGAPPSGTNNISVRHLGVAGIPNVPSTGSVVPASLSTGAPSWASSGNVGVGTSTGGGKLQVAVGTTNISGSAWNSSNFVVGGSNSTSGGFGVSYNDTTGTIIASLLPSTAWKNLTTYSSQTIFCSDGTNERMRIDSSGNLLVGTTTNPAPSRVTVDGGSSIVPMSTRVTPTTGFTHHYFYNGNGIVGSISTNGSSTTYSTSSDYRLKENVSPMTGALAKVSALKPVTYSWKVDGSAGEGFIAHELQAVVPDCVTGEKDAVDEEGNPVYQGIDTSFLVATLTAAIQELKAELDATKAEVASLKGVVA